jgi:hypothetical protein
MALPGPVEAETATAAGAVPLLRRKQQAPSRPGTIDDGAGTAVRDRDPTTCDIFQKKFANFPAAPANGRAGVR